MTNPNGNNPSETVGMRARTSQTIELCVFLQVACAFLALFMSTRNQTVAVGLSALACALDVPVLGTIAMSLIGGKKEGPDERIGAMESLLETVIAIAVSCVCLFSFFPRFGKFAEKNPYSNKETLQCIVQFVVGKQFVVPGSIQSDGLIMKVPEGKEVVPPTVFPKPGLTFVGWRYAGTGDPDIAVGTPIYLDANGTRNNSVTLYAEYVDAEGTTYCACGAIGEKEFAGTSWQGMNTRNFVMVFAPASALLLVYCIVVATRKKASPDGPDGSEACHAAGDENLCKEEDVPVADDEMPSETDAVPTIEGDAPTDEPDTTDAVSDDDGDELAETPAHSSEEESHQDDGMEGGPSPDDNGDSPECGDVTRDSDDGRADA